MPVVIEIKSLIKNYKVIQAVKGIDFTVREGSFFAFLGENGAAKSTTINIIATLIKKTSGDVIINQHHIDKDDDLIRNDIGVVFQGNNRISKPNWVIRLILSNWFTPGLLVGYYAFRQ